MCRVRYKPLPAQSLCMAMWRACKVVNQNLSYIKRMFGVRLSRTERRLAINWLTYVRSSSLDVWSLAHCWLSKWLDGQLPPRQSNPIWATTEYYRNSALAAWPISCVHKTQYAQHACCVAAWWTLLVHAVWFQSLFIATSRSPSQREWPSVFVVAPLKRSVRPPANGKVGAAHDPLLSSSKLGALTNRCKSQTKYKNHRWTLSLWTFGVCDNCIAYSCPIY